MSENNSNSSDCKSLLDEGILASSQLNMNSITKSCVLRPSVLGTSVNTVSVRAETEKNNKCMGTSINPFTKTAKDDFFDETDVRGSKMCATSIENYKEVHDERPDPLKLLSRNGIERSSLFTAAKNSIPRVAKTGYVFGQNVHERVVGDNVVAECFTASAPDNAYVASNSNCLLFSSVVENAAATKASISVREAQLELKNSEPKSLNEVAREYEESRAQKRKYEEVETFTGEENEINILDISCKLYAFINSNWQERGRGNIRLNDAKNEIECSRVVFRTSGNLRLLVNTKVWAGMVADRHSPKSLRLTAMDNNGQIKIFLIMARPMDIIILHKSLAERINSRKSLYPAECSLDIKEAANGNSSLNKVCVDEPSKESNREQKAYASKIKLASENKY